MWQTLGTFYKSSKQIRIQKNQFKNFSGILNPVKQKHCTDHIKDMWAMYLPK